MSHLNGRLLHVGMTESNSAAVAAMTTNLEWTSPEHHEKEAGKYSGKIQCAVQRQLATSMY